MSFLVSCPYCGPRDVYEFRWGGEYSQRPAPGSPRDTWVAYLYLRANAAGEQQEWWFHRSGCGRWFQAVRDTRMNEVKRTFWPGAPPPPPEPAPVRAPASPAQRPSGAGGGDSVIDGLAVNGGAVEAPSE